MKTKLILLTSLFFISFLCNAQESQFDKDVLKFLEINGSKKTMEPTVDLLIKQFRSMKSDVPSDFWALLKLDLTADLTELNRKMVPIYKKHFTHEEIKGLIEFYESPVGESYASKSGDILKESMAIGQQWGMQLGAKIQQKLSEEGY